jgi:hypothetical protein
MLAELKPAVAGADIKPIYPRISIWSRFLSLVAFRFSWSHEYEVKELESRNHGCILGIQDSGVWSFSCHLLPHLFSVFPALFDFSLLRPLFFKKCFRAKSAW